MQLKKILLLVGMAASVSCLAKSTSVNSNPDVKSFVEQSYQDVLNNWKVVSSDGTRYLLSPPSKIISSQKYCVSLKVPLLTNKDGSFKTLGEQLVESKPYFIYALNQQKRSCDSLDESEYFYAESFNSREPSVVLMTIAEKVVARSWLKPQVRVKHEISYLNESAKKCLSEESYESLSIHRLIEVDSTGEGSTYHMLSSCNFENTKWYLDILIHESVDGSSFEYSARASTEAERECLRRECYKYNN